MKHDLPSFAVLIDADNVRLDTITPIFEEITRHARITVRRIYGDFTSQNLANWKNRLAELAIQPIQQYRNTIGKNASDSALIIDAMDLLHSGRFEGFCLVSSDSDFTRLATRIREDGLVVYGFGEKKAPKAFVNACDRYIYVENLLGTLANDRAAALRRGGNGAVAVDAPKSPPRQGRDAPAAETDMATASKTAVVADFVSPAEATDLLMRAYDNVADDQGWAMLGRLSSNIYANHTDFDPRTYGCAKFIELLQKNGTFKLVQRAYKNGQTYFCRPKQSGKEAAASMPIPRVNDTAYTPQEKLRQALISASGADGWAPIGVIGQKLKALGGTVKELGVSTLTKAVEEIPEIESRGKGPARYFRMRPTKE